ncbi:MAG: ribosomal protein [Verrucomicrobiales bacterium]|nr:ribosomal protein [Verrucomicrobiales bacterium]
MRNSARKQTRNHSEKARLHTLETNYAAFVTAGKKDDATKALRSLTAALDKAAKRGVIHASNASRKKSRLTIRLNKVAAVKAKA